VSKAPEPLAHLLRHTTERWGRRGREYVGVFAGLPVSLLTPLWALACGTALLTGALHPPSRTRSRETAARWTHRLNERDLERLSRWTGITVRSEASARRRALHLLFRLPLHLVSFYAVFAWTGLAVLLTAGTLWQTVTGSRSEVHLTWPGVQILSTTTSIGAGLILGLMVLTWFTTALVAAAERGLARALLGLDTEILLHRRIDELTRTRAGAVQAVDEERRRIERDLHDGVQQQVVALAMLLGRAQRAQDPQRSRELVRQAHTESRILLDELREVAWRVYPATLDALGLEAALAEAAGRSPLPVTLRAEPSRPLPDDVATAVYFVAREALTNAAKHSGADGIILDLNTTEEQVELVVSDDGRGGADPEGGGLTGLARRVAAFDGVLTVDSPPGGPTTVRAVLPLGHRDPSTRTRSSTCVW
jgi:signal transduction histidine kinase